MTKLLAVLIPCCLACLLGGWALAQPPLPDPPGDPLRIGQPVLIVQADGSTVPGIVALCWVPVAGGKGGPDLPQAAPLPTATPTPPPGRDPTRTPRGGPPRTPTRIVVIPGSVTVVPAISPTPGPPWGP